jgi:hypothetical protein
MKNKCTLSNNINNGIQISKLKNLEIMKAAIEISEVDIPLKIIKSACFTQPLDTRLDTPNIIRKQAVTLKS